MIETHTIRLRGPWECDAGNGPVQRVQTPVTTGKLVGGLDAAELRCQRRFGCPTCLDKHERVWLVVERPASSADVHLNGTRLGTAASDAASEFDVTALLRERNLLILDFDICAGSDNEPLFGDVRLEIRG
jgi:hypothetical protein